MARQLSLLASACAARRAAHGERRAPEGTPLYAVVHEHLESFLAEAERRERTVPRFVERELRAYLECGLLQFGFVRVRCASCGEAGRSAACGAVTFVQRSGDALNLNLHFHSLVLDGVYLEGTDGSPRFRPLPPPSDAEVERITRTLARRLQRLLERRGLLEADAPEADPLASEAPLLAELCAASVRGRIAAGPRAGRPLLRLGDRIDVEDAVAASGPRCANVAGVSLHANVCAPARDRKRLERLCRYVSRPPIASERLSRLVDGRVLYRLKRRWRDGTTHVLFEPVDFLGCVAALVPPPRAHLVRYHGVLASAARRRAAVVAERTPRPAGGDERAGGAFGRGSRSVKPQPPPLRGAQSLPPGSTDADRPAASPRATERSAPAGGLPGPEGPQFPPRARRLSWSELMRRIFAVDVLECPRCRGRMRIVAAIDHPEVIAKILTHLGLPARARPRDRPEPASSPLPTAKRPTSPSPARPFALAAGQHLRPFLRHPMRAMGFRQPPCAPLSPAAPSAPPNRPLAPPA